MNAAYCHIDGVLDNTVIALDTYKIALEVVVDLHIVESCIVLAVDLSDLVELLLESPSYERRHIEVECRDGLATVHLVLYSLHRDTSEDTCSLDSLCRT